MMDSGTVQYFEDYIVGVEQVVGDVSLSEAEMIDFASKYDPQDFHVDPEKAAPDSMNCDGWPRFAPVMY